jgi:hypothetical protein
MDFVSQCTDLDVIKCRTAVLARCTHGMLHFRRWSLVLLFGDPVEPAWQALSILVALQFQLLCELQASTPSCTHYDRAGLEAQHGRS